MLRIATRASLLAQTQSQHVGELVRALTDRPFELVPVTTKGDSDRTSALTSLGGTGVFVTAVRDALLDGRADIAVHSFKDLPTAPAAGLMIRCVPQREDPVDVLCTVGEHFDSLPPNAVIGTGSPRRAAQLLARRPDIRIVPVRGNVDTRLRMVEERRLDGVVLAHAGLARLHQLDRATERLDWLLPAPAQGALAVECLRSDAQSWFGQALSELDDAEARARVIAERAVLATLEAGCAAPLGTATTIDSGIVHLRAAAFAPDGSRHVRDEDSAPLGEARRLGEKVARRLLLDGASELIDAHP